LTRFPYRHVLSLEQAEFRITSPKPNLKTYPAAG
jgi:hypothetical protein